MVLEMKPIRTSDIDGSPNADECFFDVDGYRYAIDLSADQRAELDAVQVAYESDMAQARARHMARLMYYLLRGTLAEHPGRPANAAPDKEMRAAVRAWVAANGGPDVQRGVLANEWYEKFAAAHAAPPLEPAESHVDEAESLPEGTGRPRKPGRPAKATRAGS